MSYDLTRLTLAQLLTSEDTTVYRNAISILKVLRECDHKPDESGRCIYCLKPIPKCRHDWDAYGKCTRCGEWDINGSRLDPDTHEIT